MEHKEYITNQTCSKKIEYDVENGKIHNVVFLGGCAGNLKGIAKLVEGRPVEEVISLLEGIKCGPKNTSCPDQLATSLKKR